MEIKYQNLKVKKQMYDESCAIEKEYFSQEIEVQEHEVKELNNQLEEAMSKVEIKRQ